MPVDVYGVFISCTLHKSIASNQCYYDHEGNND